MGGRSETTEGLRYDYGAELARNYYGVVGRAVVYHDCPVPGRKARQHPRKRRLLVKTRKYHVDVDQCTAARSGAVANSRIPSSNVIAGVHPSSSRRRADEAVMWRTSPSR